MWSSTCYPFPVVSHKAGIKKKNLTEKESFQLENLACSKYWENAMDTNRKKGWNKTARNNYFVSWRYTGFSVIQQHDFLEASGITLTDHLVSQKHNWISSYQNSSPKCMPWVCHLEHTTTTASSKTTSRTSSMIGIVSVGTFATIVLNYSWCTMDGKSAH